MFRKNIFKKSFLQSSFKRFSTGYDYDLAVIGGGPGGISFIKLGYVAAIKAGQKGLKTVCIEKRGALGGTCLNVGCIPSKALLNITHKYHEAKHAFKDMGIQTGEVSYDLPKMMTYKEKVVKGLTSGIEGLFKKNKVDYLKGSGAFKTNDTLTVKLNDGGEKTIRCKNIIIATGSEPNNLPGGVLPIDENRVISSTGALSLKQVPKKLLVVGGGVIGLEMGSVYNRLGAEVEVIEFADKILANFDNEVSSLFTRILKKQGMKFNLSHKVVGGSTSANGVKVVIEDVKNPGKMSEVSADYVLVATGRRPYTNGLGLENVNIQTDKLGRIPIDQHLQTKVPGVYAIGDVIEGPMLAHKGEEEGISVVETICGQVGHVNYFSIPNVVYTHPEIAYVGFNEEELKAKKVDYSKGFFPFIANSRARTNDDYDGFVKVLTEKATDKIVGIQIIGPNAGEMIAEAVLAVEYGASAEDIARTCHAHPTLSEALKEACLGAWEGKPIHI